jgi:hypothetical protein
MDYKRKFEAKPEVLSLSPQTLVGEFRVRRRGNHVIPHGDRAEARGQASAWRAPSRLKRGRCAFVALPQLTGGVQNANSEKRHSR